MVSENVGPQCKACLEDLYDQIPVEKNKNIKLKTAKRKVRKRNKNDLCR
jgi:hypothetical protein